jgi:hypothetical protein
MTSDSQQFKLIQAPRSGCGFFMLLAFLFLGIGGPFIFTAQVYGGTLAFFAAFFVVAFLLQWINTRWLQAKVMVTADSLGILIEVTRGGLGIPLGSNFYAWDQLKGFKYSKRGKGPYSLMLHWTDGSKISFEQEAMESFYQFLKEVCAEKEMDYLLWPPK